jgi:hypothetical protein
MGIEYEIEGDVDFFNELKQMSSSTANAVKTAPAPAATPRCLITDEPLRRDHVTLQCGHKFNYVPLFKDVLFQKCSLLPKNLSTSIITMYTKDTPTVPTASTATATAAPTTGPAHSSIPTYQSQTHTSNVLSVTYNSSYNLETTKLQYNEIKCPYCRSITPSILPYYPYPDVSKVKYVNVPPNMSLPAVSCEYEQYISGTKTAFATNEPTASCKSACVYNEKYDVMLCNKHLNKLETQTSTSAVTRTRKPKSNTNTNTNTIDDENVIVSHHNPATTVCSFLLLSGARKGTPCGKPMWIPKGEGSPVIVNGAYCKTHYAKVK